MNLENKDSALVSIVVITYNSSDFVLETLESAKAQTYKNVELIISDDCSKDNTIQICRDWLEKNSKRFVSTKLLEAPVNTGISANCNRGLNAASGEWLKFIAGDDILFTSAIEDLKQFVRANKNGEELSFLYGGCQFILDGKLDKEMQIPSTAFQQMNAYEQYLSLLLNGNNIHGPTAFFNRKKMKELSGFDESIPFSEDWPLFIKATKNRNKLFFLNKSVAGYRIHDKGIFSKTKMGLTYDSKLNQSVNLIRKKYVIPNLLSEKFYSNAFHTWVIYKKETQKNRVFKHLYQSLLLLSPQFYKNKFGNSKTS